MTVAVKFKFCLFQEVKHKRQHVRTVVLCTHFQFLLGWRVHGIIPCHKIEGTDNAKLFVELVHSCDSFLHLLSFA